MAPSLALAVAFSGPMKAEQNPASEASGSAYTLPSTNDGMRLTTPDGRTVWEYLTGTPEGSALISPSVACLRPFNTPSGVTATSLGRDDHPHLRGVYLAWHDTEFRQPITPRGGTGAPFGWNFTTADFWGWGEYAPREGRIIQNRPCASSAHASQATVEIRNDWNVGRRKMLDEVTTATTFERDGRSGCSTPSSRPFSPSRSGPTSR